MPDTVFKKNGAFFRYTRNSNEGELAPRDIFCRLHQVLDGFGLLYHQINKTAAGFKTGLQHQGVGSRLNRLLILFVYKKPNTKKSVGRW